MNTSDSSSTAPHFLHVAVGVIKNRAGEVLISQRAAHVHQGGLWEFPGGKVEAGESVPQALTRELQEELGITVLHCEPLIKIPHHYTDLSVLLDVWTVTQFSGQATGQEGQAIQWLSADKLDDYAFPAANRPIIRAVQLPDVYAIIDDGQSADLMADLQRILDKQIKLVQARLKQLSDPAVTEFLHQARPLCVQYGAKLLLNSAVNNAQNRACDGWHLTSADLMRLNQRPLFKGWLAASCHNREQLQHAQKIGLDFAVLAPVLKTQTHPDAQVLGWQHFTELVAEAGLPVYALGGLSGANKPIAKACGAQGIAGIRTFLD